MTSVPLFASTPNNGKVTIVNADGSNQKTVYTGAAGGSKIFAMILNSTDTVLNHDVQISILRGGTNYPLGTISVPLNSGFNSGVAGINAFAPGQLPGLPVDSDGNPEILLNDASDSLQISSATTMTAATMITALVFAADFTPLVQPQVPTYPQTINVNKAQILNATGTGTITLYTAGANGSKIKRVIARSTDTIFHGMGIFLNDGTQWRLGTSRINAAGSASTFPSVDLLHFFFNGVLLMPGIPFDADGNFLLLLKANEKLQINTGQTVTAGTALNFTTIGVDF